MSRVERCAVVVLPAAVAMVMFAHALGHGASGHAGAAAIHEILFADTLAGVHGAGARGAGAFDAVGSFWCVSFGCGSHVITSGDEKLYAIDGVGNRTTDDFEKN